MKPILFNTEMVKAILDGKKTVTRRIINPRYRDDEGGFQVVTTRNGEFIRVEKVDENECGIFADGSERSVNSPYDVGDILYVQETWRVFQTYPDVFGYDILYKSDEYIKPCIFSDTNRYLNKFMKYEDKNGWQSPYFMPKEAARIFLRVTDIRAERLQDITEEQATKEGCTTFSKVIGDGKFEDVIEFDLTAKDAFSELWDSTIKKQDLDTYGWEANPCVWVIAFEKCNKPEEI
ncbi:hypothetical protein [Anaerovorax sp. IOR16]|uniref:hypothetical protein n=1 Tax=Anaerovorax sp. IOR16 TaxID=2773458 RepID=UPI0019D2FB11|nr:hypothetical protein [Anaerovorax sp. IOR16]